MIRHARPQMGGHDSNLCFSRSAPRSQWSIPLCLIDGRRGPPLSPPRQSRVGGPEMARDWFGIVSGLARERLGEVGESKRVSKTGLSVFGGETARNAVSTSDHGYRCHVELEAETVRFDYVSITCRLRVDYVSFTCFTAEYPLIYLFRAPHLLRILATGNYSVQFLLYLRHATPY